MTATGPIAAEARTHRDHSRRLPGPQTPGLVSTTTTFAGLLLLLAPLLWSNTAGLWTVAGWNEAIMGVALTVIGFVRLAFPVPLVLATGLGCAVGAWLTVSPMLLNYGFDDRSTAATIVDVLIGIGVLLVTVIGHIDARAATH